MNRFSLFVVKTRGFIVTAILIITLASGFFASRLEVNSDIISYLPKPDPAVKVLHHIGKKYGGNYLAVIALQTEDIFNKQTLETMDNLTSQLQRVEGVAYVTSLTNVLDIEKSEEGIEIGKLIEQSDFLFGGPGTIDSSVPSELNALKTYVLTKDRFKGQLVSEDARSTLIVCRLSEGADQIKTAIRIKRIIETTNLKETVQYGGLPFQIMDITRIILRDLRFLVPFISILMIIVLGFSFRSLRGVLLPLISVLISTVWTMGVMSILKVPMTIISDIIPVILISVGSAYSIHVISKFDEEFSGLCRAEQKREKTIKALSAVGIPVLLAAITTIAGFISFAFGSYLTAILEFGIFSALGVFFALVISMTFVPVMLNLVSYKRSGPWLNTNNRPAAKTDMVTVLMNRLGRLIPKKAKVILALTAIVCVAACFGIPRIARRVEIIGYFNAKSNIRKTEAMMDKEFGGSIPIQILVKGDIQDPAVLAEMKKMEDYLKKETGVKNLLSIVDFIEEMNDVMGEGKTIPGSREKISNLYFLLEGEEIMSQLIDRNKKEAIIQGTVCSSHSEKRQVLVDNIDRYIRKTNSPLVTFVQAGPLLSMQHLDHSLLQSQVMSLVLALIMVFVCVIFLLHSFLGGLIGLIPISFTLVTIFGFMGFFRIPLDIATVLVGSVAVGTGIDYTIHFISRFRKELATGKTKAMALELTLQTTGKAILINVATVMTGFLVLVFASLIPLQRFGILVAITTLGSGLGAITILPAIIFLTNIKYVKFKKGV